MGDLSPAKAQTIAKATQAAAAKRRAMTHCKKGHPLSGDNLVNRKNGRRQCKTCRDDCQKYSKLRRFLELKRDPNDPRHGTTTGYNTGCRCFRCRVANSEYRRSVYDPEKARQKKWRAKQNSQQAQ